MTTSGAVRPPTIPGLTYAGLLGQGGQAAVFEYVQALPSRHVAVKVLTAAVSDAELLTQIVNEANVMAGLEHPFIVTVYAAGVTEDDRPYLVMQYYPGGSLVGQLQRRAQAETTGPAGRGLHVGEVLRLGMQVGGAVATAHAAGVLHRDIKPHNILLSAHGTPGLSDFGISSRIVHTGPAESVSLPWAPPEALRGDGQMTVASDVYSLGATLWHLLVGHPPFNPPGTRLSADELADRIELQPTPPTGRPDVPASLEALLASCLAKDPRARPQTVHDLVRGLGAIERELRLSPTDAFLPSAPVDAARQEAAALEAHLTTNVATLAVRREGTSGPNRALPREGTSGPPAPLWDQGAGIPPAGWPGQQQPWPGPAGPADGWASGPSGGAASGPHGTRAFAGPGPGWAAGPLPPAAPARPPQRGLRIAALVGAAVVVLAGAGIGIALSPVPGLLLPGSPSASPTAAPPASTPPPTATAPPASTPPPATTAPPTRTTTAQPSTAAPTVYPAVAVPEGSKECFRDPNGGPWAAAGTANATTSCGFAINVREGYLASGINGGTGTFHAYSPETKLDYVVTCSGTQPVLCTGGVRGRVIIYGGRLVAG